MANIVDLNALNNVRAWTNGVEVEHEAAAQVKNTAALPIVAGHVAIMPDVHLGKGATVGSVIPTRGAIIPAAVGVDIGCFTGDTHVPLLDGSVRKIGELADAARETSIYACTDSGKVVAARAAAKLTRRNSALVRVVLDNGREVRCTPDQRFMLRDGSYLEAEQLQPGSSLMPLYRETDREGYTLVQQNYSGRWQKAHWIVARSGLLGPVPRFEGQRTVIHHKNFDEGNNDPTNLEFVGNADHSALHRKLIDRNDHWHSAEFEEKRVKALAAKAQTQAGHEYFAARGTKNILKYMQERRDHFCQAVAGNGLRGKGFLTAYNRSERGRAKSKEIANRLFECEACGEKVRSGIGLHNHRRGIHGYNHKVVSVCWLAEREDVYCLSVPQYYNFALEAGVFVHNCGMVAQRTSLTANDLPDSLAKIRSAIEARVPVGFSAHDKPVSTHSEGLFGIALKRKGDELHDRYQRLRIMDRVGRFDHKRVWNQVGTLGGGNHFVELCLDESDAVWIMLHSGSRNVGKTIGETAIGMAREMAVKQHRHLPDRDLAWLDEGSPEFDEYVEGLRWAQEYAAHNRNLMLHAVLKSLRAHFSDAFGREIDTHEHAVNCHHNYSSLEEHFGERVWITRKGAVSARAGELGIIPGSMGARSFIVRGKGNAGAYHSCSHGAGRRLSRNAAKRQFTLEDLRKQTEGVECRKDAGVLDEIPGAYKDIDAVMAAQADLVEVVHTLKQIMCIKG